MQDEHTIPEQQLMPVIKDFFYQLVHKLVEIGEVSYTNVFVDVTKIEANTNKYSFVHIRLTA